MATPSSPRAKVIDYAKRETAEIRLEMDGGDVEKQCNPSTGQSVC